LFSLGIKDTCSSGSSWVRIGIFGFSSHFFFKFRGVFGDFDHVFGDFDHVFGDFGVFFEKNRVLLSVVVYTTRAIYAGKKTSSIQIREAVYSFPVEEVEKEPVCNLSNLYVYIYIHTYN
jgi:hypothetical protein